MHPQLRSFTGTGRARGSTTSATGRELAGGGCKAVALASALEARLAGRDCKTRLHADGRQVRALRRATAPTIKGRGSAARRRRTSRARNSRRDGATVATFSAILSAMGVVHASEAIHVEVDQAAGRGTLSASRGSKPRQGRRAGLERGASFTASPTLRRSCKRGTIDERAPALRRRREIRAPAGSDRGGRQAPTSMHAHARIISAALSAIEPAETRNLRDDALSCAAACRTARFPRARRSSNSARGVPRSTRPSALAPRTARAGDSRGSTSPRNALLARAIANFDCITLTSRVAMAVAPAARPEGAPRSAAPEAPLPGTLHLLAARPPGGAARGRSAPLGRRAGRAHRRPRMASCASTGGTAARGPAMPPRSKVVKKVAPKVRAASERTSADACPGGGDATTPLPAPRASARGTCSFHSSLARRPLVHARGSPSTRHNRTRRRGARTRRCRRRRRAPAPKPAPKRREEGGAAPVNAEAVDRLLHLPVPPAEGAAGKRFAQSKVAHAKLKQTGPSSTRRASTRATAKAAARRARRARRSEDGNDGARVRQVLTRGGFDPAAARRGLTASTIMSIASRKKFALRNTSSRARSMRSKNWTYGLPGVTQHRPMGGRVPAAVA